MSNHLTSSIGEARLPKLVINEDSTDIRAVHVHIKNQALVDMVVAVRNTRRN